MIKIKICGIRTTTAAIHASENGADFIGMIFVPNRRRTISVNDAKKVIEKLRSKRNRRSLTVGLFADQPIRDIIEIRSVVSKTVNEKVGYLRLRAFNENSSNQLKKAILQIEKNNKLVGYILDLRNNPGGLLSQAIKISDLFLNAGEIVSTRGRNNADSRKYFAKKGDKIDGKPLIVLINNGSASASEIVAGALQDQKRAVLLGETTFGKGSVQSIIPLKNNGAIRLTVSKYYLPSGKSISEVGVVPDIRIEEKGEEFSINTASDNQLNYAIDLLIG